MSRPIIGKIVVKCSFRARTPISVGGAGAGDSVDLELAYNGSGAPYVPGTSLAGPIRHWLDKNLVDRDVVDRDVVEKMFGFQKIDKGHASFVYIEDAVVELPEEMPVEIRNGVQIDRGSGSARERFLFDRAVLPRGSKFDLRLELDLPDTSHGGMKKMLRNYSADDFEAVLRLLLENMKEGGFQIGAAKTRGLGRLELLDMEIQKFFFPTAEKDGTGLFDWLARRDGEKISVADLKESSKVSVKESTNLSVEIQWEPVGPVMVKAGQDGIKTDMLPLVGAVGDGQVVPVIPGSSLKGTFRARAAKIIRTLLQKQMPGGSNDPDPDCDLCETFLSDLFGGPDRIGRLSVDDVYQSTNPINIEDYREDDGKALDSSTVKHTRVAIDRLTGGASNSALFNLRTPITDKKWEPIKLALDFSWKVDKETDLEPVTRNAEKALFYLLIRDLQENRLPIGFGTMRGLGEVRIKEMKITDGPMQLTWNAEDGKRLFQCFPDDELANLNLAWKQAIDAKFQREKLNPKQKESSGKEGRA